MLENERSKDEQDVIVNNILQAPRVLTVELSANGDSWCVHGETSEQFFKRAVGVGARG